MFARDPFAVRYIADFCFPAFLDSRPFRGERGSDEPGIPVVLCEPARYSTVNTGERP